MNRARSSLQEGGRRLELVRRYPLIHFLGVRVRVARVPLQSRENLASAKGIARDFLIEVFLANFFEVVEGGFYKRQIIGVVKIVRPVVGRVVIERKMTPGSH